MIIIKYPWIKYQSTWEILSIDAQNHKKIDREALIAKYKGDEEKVTVRNKNEVAVKKNMPS